MNETDRRNKVERDHTGKDERDPNKEGDTSMEKGEPGKEEGEPWKEEGDPWKEEEEPRKEEGDPSKEEEEPGKEEGDDILIYADYDVFPFWVMESDGLLNCSPDLFVNDLGLVQALEEWSDDSTADYLPEDPGSMKPKSFRERLFLEFQGIVLSHQVQENLKSISPKYTVQFHSSLLFRRSSDFRSLIEQLATLVDEIVEDDCENETPSKIVTKHLNRMESAVASSSSGNSQSQFWSNLDFAGPKGWTVLEFIAKPKKISHLTTTFL